MTQKQDVGKDLGNMWEAVSEELFKLNGEIEPLKSKRESLLSQLEAILNMYDAFGGRPASLIVPPELLAKKDESIGDSMERILKGKGPMEKAKLVRELQAIGKLNTKNARIILTNAIKRDGRKRFDTKKGKVSLNEK